MGAAGHTIYADMISHAKSGGAYNVYDLFVIDNTSLQGCSTTNYSFPQMGVPYYALFMGERPTLSGGAVQALAQFNTFSFTNAQLYYSGSLVGIYTPYSQTPFGWDTWEPMRNTCSDSLTHENITPSSVSTSNSFTETWNTSCGTG